MPFQVFPNCKICDGIVKIEREREREVRIISKRRIINNRNFAHNKLRYGAVQIANNTGADQTARLRRLVCAFVIRKPPKTEILATRPI